MKRLRYYADLIVAPLAALVLTALFGFGALPFAGGAVAWSFSEYAAHRWFLHGRKGKAFHMAHHARPGDTILDTAWQVYAGLVLALLLFGPSFAAGALVSYAWYLYVHHCTHHFPQGIPSSLMDHHEGHHRFARRNYGVGTVAWDHLFGTRLCSTN